MNQQILTFIAKQLFFLFGIQTVFHFYLKNLNQASSFIYIITPLISVIYCISEFYQYFFLTHHDIWNLNPIERMETRTEVAFFILCWTISSDLFDIIMGIYFQRLELIYLIHHLLAIVASYVTLITPTGQVYCCYYCGVAQISSIFLNLRARELNLSPQLFFMINVMFVITFLFNRILTWSWINQFYFHDAIESLQIKPNNFGMSVQCLCLILLTFLQYYWGYEILQKLISKWPWTTRKNIKKSL